ncbi:DUF3558 domain-containing protein [Prescottella equi]|uniref:DUF3558 domain-containing protein n=1 Tax=Rhodococcus hoagii TaxID=43767 RepID=UPI001EE9DE8F|nr:DUF3558 domain-containing protein [Prescottella equi]
MRVTAAIGLIGVGLLLAGCGSGTVSGDADAQGTAAGEPVFSPCDDIPDQVLVELGLDPATESRDILGVSQPGWKLCRWDGKGYILTVFSTTRSLEEVRENSRNTDFREQFVGGREAFSYHERADTRQASCDVAVKSRDGAAIVRVTLSVVDPAAADRCQLAVDSMNTLESGIPR